MWTTLNFKIEQKRKKKKKGSRDICKGALDVECEQDWWDSVDAILGDGENIRNYKLIKFIQNYWIHFWENRNFKFFLMWTTLNFKCRSKIKMRTRDICKRIVYVKFEWDWSVGLGPMLGDGKNRIFSQENLTVLYCWVSNIPYIREYSAPSNNPRTLILGQEIFKNNKNGLN